MSTVYIQSLLPSWVTLTGEIGGFDVDSSFQFQLEWERKLSAEWYSLTDAEREGITPIKPPYTEEGVVAFLELLKETKANRSMFGSIVSILPDVREDKVFPIEAMKGAPILEELAAGRHPVLFSWMKRIEAGAFMMGALDKDRFANSDWEKPRRRVVLEHSLLIGQYPVTKGFWSRVMESNLGGFEGSNLPVEQVCWLDCILFCNKLSELDGVTKVYGIPAGLEAALRKKWDWSDDRVDALSKEVVQNVEANGYRLPTEAEWEYCARANQDFLYSGSDNCDEVAWTYKNSGKKLHPVGQKNANGFGLYDMSGNVWEWCWDWFAEESPSNPPNDPTGPSTGSKRVGRGGCWKHAASLARVSSRTSMLPSIRRFRGFRICRTIC